MACVHIADAADPADPVLDIAVSENLILLLSKLYTPGSRCELRAGDVPDGCAYARIRAEPDDCHYASPTRRGAPPGPMHPLAELVLAVVRAVLANAAEHRAEQ